MTDSIAFGADGQANHALTVLRRQDAGGDLTQNVSFVPGVMLNADPELGLSGTWRSAENRVLEFDASIQGLGNWLGLHISVPLQDTRGHGIAGFAARIQAQDIFVARASLRSGTEGGFVDCFFDKHMLFTPDEATHVDALQLHQRDTIPATAPWREIVLFLPTESFKLDLIDLRVFVV